MDTIYQHVSEQTSRLITHSYSTSFSIGVKCLHTSVRSAIYNIYGFVRMADEIVDTFHHPEQAKMFDEFETAYYLGRRRGMSLNPVIHAFIKTVERYRIPEDLIIAFLQSMRRDLYRQSYDEMDIKEYIYGSAEVVGLMCLKVFVKGDDGRYAQLKPYAMRLGAAFQKVNFLRDLGHDITQLHRVYFPILRYRDLDEGSLGVILKDIEQDYREALIGIKQLPVSGRLGVYVAYRYYRALTFMIAQTAPSELMNQRIRVTNLQKISLFIQAMIENKFSIYR